MQSLSEQNSVLLTERLVRFSGGGSNVVLSCDFKYLSILCLDVYVDTHDLWQKTVKSLSLLIADSRSIGKTSPRCLLALIIETMRSYPALDRLSSSTLLRLSMLLKKHAAIFICAFLIHLKEKKHILCYTVTATKISTNDINEAEIMNTQHNCKEGHLCRCTKIQSKRQISI